MKKNEFHELGSDRLLRLADVLKIIPVCKSTWWKGVQDGRFPKLIKLGPGITCWRYSEIQPLITRGIRTDTEDASDSR